LKLVENELSEELGEHGNGPGRGHKRDDNGTSFNNRGSNSADYLLSRLKRDAPDIPTISAALSRDLPISACGKFSTS
jgi:hypothetical protein